MTSAVLVGIALLAAAAGVGAVSWLDHGDRHVPPGLVFEDNFDGTKLDTKKWTPYNSPGNGDNGLRRSSAFSLDGHGALVVTARMAGGRIVSGGMASRRSFRYGRFEVRVRTEPDPTGTMSGVVLTWPQSGNWPAEGENDIYETGTDANGRSPFHSFIHYGADNEQYEFTHRADGARWQTVVMDWRRSAIRIYRDGRLVGRVGNRAAIPDVPHFLAVQLDAMTTRRLTRPVRMYVDYVRVFR
jgi:beta-glucanase (GH16 family)